MGFKIFMKNNNIQNGSTSLTTGGFTAPIIIVVVILVLLAGGVFYFLSNQQQSAEEKAMIKKEGEVMMEKEDDSMVKDEPMIKYSGSVIAGKLSPLLDFNKTDYDQALSTDKLLVLYFYANWCPICKVEIASALYPAFNELTGDKVIGFRVNYNDNKTDNDEKNLAREFGIAYQHTKVFLKNGQRVLKSPESWNKSRYLEEINKYSN